MLSTELEYICTQLECFLQGWNAFDSVGIHLHIVGMLSTGLARLRQGWNASTGLECFRQSWNTFVQSWNAFCSVGMLSSELECFRQSWNSFVQG
jgi:hypothetical protein